MCVYINDDEYVHEYVRMFRLSVPDRKFINLKQIRNRPKENCKGRKLFNKKTAKGNQHTMQK